MSDIESFRIESPEFEYGYKLVVLAADHDRVVAAIKRQHDIRVDLLQKELDRERAKVAALEKVADRAKQRSLGVVKVVK